MGARMAPGTHHLGYNLKAIEQDADSVSAIFENGERVTGDLLVGADGFRSVVRNMFAPMIQPIYAGYVVWRGLADEDVIPKEAHAAVFNKFAFFLPPHNKNIGYPIAGPNNDLRPGHRRWELVWCRGRSLGALRQLRGRAEGAAHRVLNPPPHIRTGLRSPLQANAARVRPPP